MHPEAKKRRLVLLRRRMSVFLVMVVVVLIILGYIGVRFSGKWLVLNQPFEHVDWAVVLDGQSADLERTDYAVDLLLAQKVDSVVVLGRRVFRDRSNADFYWEDMQRQGDVDMGRVLLLRHNDNSSIEEAGSIIPALKLRDADTVLLITRGAASRRVNRIFNHLSGGSPVFITTNLEDPYYNARTWIHHRESRKVWIKEWASYLASFVELVFMRPLEPIPGKPYPLERAAASRKVEEILLPILNSSSMSSSSSVLDSVDAKSSSSAGSSSTQALPELDEDAKPAKTKAKTDPAQPGKTTEKKPDSKDAKKPAGKSSP